LRAPDGKITTFGVPGSLTIDPLAINSANVITGYVLTDTCHGFLRTRDGAITQFDPPGSFCTAPTEINSPGAIVGIYHDANGVQHGFLRLP
jgi:hypothetical protein